MIDGLNMDFDLDLDLDLDEDGVNETAVAEMDSDMDGIIDQVVIMSDTDEDGMVDHFYMAIDGDGDQHADMTLQGDMLTSGNDMGPDIIAMEVDIDGDQIIDAVGIFEYDADDHSVDVISLEFIQGEADEISGIPDLPNFDPEQADPEAVCGDPASSMAEWEYQGRTGRCALYSQKFVIEELTGMDLNIEEMADIAEAKGWFSEEGGTTMRNMNKMLDFYGVENEMTFDNSFEDIRRCLENNGKVIVTVDSDEIWFGEQDNLFTPRDSANHALQVIGIDETDPGNPMVILNDSGTPDGRGEMVPLKVFIDAWEDGFCQMIACY